MRLTLFESRSKKLKRKAGSAKDEDSKINNTQKSVKRRSTRVVGSTRNLPWNLSFLRNVQGLFWSAYLGVQVSYRWLQEDRSVHKATQWRNWSQGKSTVGTLMHSKNGSKRGSAIMTLIMTWVSSQPDQMYPFESTISQSIVATI